MVAVPLPPPNVHLKKEHILFILILYFTGANPIFAPTATPPNATAMQPQAQPLATGVLLGPSSIRIDDTRDYQDDLVPRRALGLGTAPSA